MFGLFTWLHCWQPQVSTPNICFFTPDTLSLRWFGLTLCPGDHSPGCTLFWSVIVREEHYRELDAGSPRTKKAEFLVFLGNHNLVVKEDVDTHNT